MAERYRLGEPLGRGGMGEVHRATDEVLGRDVAVKLLLPVQETLAAKERFLREARAAAMVDDPHVVAALDFGHHGEGYFLAMELVEGHSVSEELRTYGPLPADRAVDIVRQAAAGLAAAHQHGIVHRDIKPGNLLLTGDGQVKVADFGIVRFLTDTTTTLTSTGQIVGTSHYLAPERALGRPAGTASDVYALGCVLYQLVTGQPPFVADDPAAIMYQHVEMNPARPSLVQPQLAGAFEELLYWMLAKEPDHRPTARQVADGVVAPTFVDYDPTGAIAQGDPITVSAALPSAALPSADPPVSADLPVSPGQPGPSRVLLAGLAAAIIAVAATTIGILLQANPLKLPSTNDLAPHPGIATPAKPGTTPSTPSSVQPRSTPVNPGATRPAVPQATPHTPAPSGPASASTGPTTPPTTRPSTPPPTSPTTKPTPPTTPPTTPPSTPPPTPPTTPPNTPPPSVTPSPALTEANNFYRS
ncbi:MAG TPA: protein kinase [Kribbella sp.]